MSLLSANQIAEISWVKVVLNFYIMVNYTISQFDTTVQSKMHDVIFLISNFLAQDNDFPAF